MAKGTKRASPGAEEEKDSILESPEITPELYDTLTAAQKVAERAAILVDRNSYKIMSPIFEKRRALAKSITNFWPIALLNCSLINFHIQHGADKKAISYLEDVWVVRDPKELRAFTLEMHFKENPFFTDSVLKKEFKYVPPPAAANETPDADGITDSMVDFSFERDIVPGTIKINWKDEENALTKLYPRKTLADDAEDLDDDDNHVDCGSFFNLFEVAKDPYDLSNTIVGDIFPEAISYFLGTAETMGSDEESDDDDDDDDAEEIDLEKPKVKKQKTA